MRSVLVWWLIVAYLTAVFAAAGVGFVCILQGIAPDRAMVETGVVAGFIIAALLVTDAAIKGELK